MFLNKDLFKYSTLLCNRVIETLMIVQELILHTAFFQKLVLMLSSVRIVSVFIILSVER